MAVERLLLQLLWSQWCWTYVAVLQERNTGGFNPELDEELEDEAGNVYSRKVYEDLKRQGLL